MSFRQEIDRIFFTDNFSAAIRLALIDHYSLWYYEQGVLTDDEAEELRQYIDNSKARASKALKDSGFLEKILLEAVFVEEDFETDNVGIDLEVEMRTLEEAVKETGSFVLETG
jgi:hypothetical protein